MAHDFRKFAGNKFSLRASFLTQVRRIDSLNKIIGASLSELLVSTWGSIFLGMSIIGLSGLIVGGIALNKSTLIKNIPSIILIILGSILIVLNVALVNPSIGSQITVSFNYIKNKYSRRTIGTDKQKLDMFKFADDSKQVIEGNILGKTFYMTIFSVRGAVSPVSFDAELNELAELNKGLMSNLERDVTIIKINAVQKANVKKKELPSNTTPEMVYMRDRKYRIVNDLKRNQQLRTTVIISSQNYNSLVAKTENVKVRFRQGLVVGYKQLSGKEAKNEIYKIYGTK